MVEWPTSRLEVSVVGKPAAKVRRARKTVYGVLADEYLEKRR